MRSAVSPGSRFPLPLSSFVTENPPTESKKEWEEVLFDLRREKFGKMYLGALLRNVETPQVEDEKLKLKFKSKTLHDLFKEEWKIDGAREAVKKAVLKVFGKDIGLVLELFLIHI